MKFRRSILSISIISLAIFLIARSRPDHSNSTSNKAIEVELTQIVHEMREIILKEKADQLLQYIDPEGLSCTDTIFPYSEVVKALKNKNSPMYLHLFDSKKVKEKCGHQYDE